MTQKIALLIPCYNESERLDIKVFKSFIKKNSSLITFYFIDDGSTDGTSEIIQNQFLQFKNCYLISLNKNLGKGNALRTGFLKEETKKHRYAAFIDADMDIPLEQVVKMYDKMENSMATIAISDRGFYKDFKFNRLRSYMSLIMVKMANNLVGYKIPIKDTQCGCKMFATEVIDICFKEPFVSQWLFDIEIFIRFKSGYKNSRNFILEVPLKINENITKSNSKLLSGHKILWQLYKIKRNYLDA